MTARPFFYKISNRIRISVRPQYLADQSYPLLRRYTFVYFVRIENVSTKTVQLISRRWQIHDSVGEDHEVAGDGVIGEQPVLEPGDVYEYKSFCLLKSQRGYMEGTYHFLVEGNTSLDAAVPRFELEVDETTQPQ